MIHPCIHRIFTLISTFPINIIQLIHPYPLTVNLSPHHHYYMHFPHPIHEVGELRTSPELFLYLITLLHNLNQAYCILASLETNAVR